MVPDPQPLTRFREKLDRELKSGLVSLLLLYAIDRTGPDYGYRLLRTLQQESDGLLAFKEGTAYPLLQNLERMGLVTSFWSDGASGPRRKYYQTTDDGRNALRHAVEDWRALTANVGRVLTGLDAKRDERGDGKEDPSA